MFSVYGTGGRLFHGEMEQLSRVAALEPVGRDGSATPLVRYQAHAIANADARPSDQAHRLALSAYEESRHQDHQRHPLTRVDSLMTREVVVIDSRSTLLQAWQLLDRHGIGQAPVVNPSSTLVGMLSRADVLRSDRLPVSQGSAMAWGIMLDQAVTHIMRSPVPGVAAQTDIRRVARVLLDTGLPGLPVIDDQGGVLGFVSRSDILRAVVTDPPLDLWG